MFFYLINYLYIRILNIFNILIYKHEINNNPIVCLTTIPSRINNITSTLNSLLLQNKLPKRIYIGIPLKSNREKQKYIIPENIKNHPMISIINLNQDYGPICKLITGLTQNLNNIFITVDDDTIYSRDFLEKLYNNYNKNTDKCIGYIGRNKNQIKKFGRVNEKIFTIEGYGGVLYHKKFFNLEEIFTFLEKGNKIVKFNDDLIISYFLKKNKVDIKLIDNSVKEPITSVLFTSYTNPLWKINESNNYYEIVSEQLKIFN
tara:strand:- start:2542 stop:3321 length:780 start_codon:yes stop_codon:yes gene_type:complete